jgi:hypothetical protein
MEVSGQLNTQVALSPEKEPPGTRWIGDWVGPKSRSGRGGKEKKSLTLPRVELVSTGL